MGIWYFEFTPLTPDVSCMKDYELTLEKMNQVIQLIPISMPFT